MHLTSWAYMIFGLAFFTYTMRWVHKDHREAHQQRVAEQREFGKPIRDKR